MIQINIRIEQDTKIEIFIYSSEHDFDTKEYLYIHIKKN